MNNRKIIYRPLIRWAGSKRQLIPHLMRQIPPKYKGYIEPFAGSACLFFALNPHSAILSDNNDELIDAYKTITRHPLRVLHHAKSFESSSEEYYRIRSIKPCTMGAISRAARFSYLNRFCYNAIYRTNKRGDFNVPLGTKTGVFLPVDVFVRSARELRRATLVCADFNDALNVADKGDFVYLDPPYVSRERVDRNEYGTGSFSTNDIPNLIASLEMLHKKRVNFLLSYSHCTDLLKILPASLEATISKSIINVRRHMSGKNAPRGFAKEVLLSNRLYSA